MPPVPRPGRRLLVVAAPHGRLYGITADEQKQPPEVGPPQRDIAVYFADDTVILAAYWALACTVDETH
jgi:hypothetical protein